MSEERFDKPRNIPANAQAIHGKAIAFPIKVCRDDEDDPSIEWYEDANGERVDPYTVMLALNAAYGTPSRVTNERECTQDEMAQLLEDLEKGVSDDPTMAQCRTASDAMKFAAELLVARSSTAFYCEGHYLRVRGDINRHRCETQCAECHSKPLEAAWHEIPVDLSHTPADYAEAVEMLRRVKRDIARSASSQPTKKEGA